MCKTGSVVAGCLGWGIRSFGKDLYSLTIRLQPNAFCALRLGIDETIGNLFLDRSRDVPHTTAGDCHDNGATRSNAGQTIGRVLSTNSSGGAYAIALGVNAAGGGVPAGTTGQVQFNSGSNTFAASPNLFWDGANYRLGIGTASPSTALQVIGTATATTFSGSGSALTSIGTTNMTAVTGTASSSTFLRGDNSWATLTIGTGSLTGTVQVSQGGTSDTSLTQYAVLLGNGTGPVNAAGPGTGGQMLLGQGASANPAFETMNGDCTLTSAGVITCTKTNGTAFGALATLGVGTGLVSSGGNLNISIPVTVPEGGTGQISLNSGVIYKGNGAGPIAASSLHDDGTEVYTAENVGIGSIAPVVSLDLSQKADALALPVGTSGTRPTGTNLANGEIRYSTSIPGIEAYINGGWTTLLASNGAGGGGVPTGSGSPNYVARWLTSTALGTGTLYDNGTQVGIGTTAPQAALETNATDSNASGYSVLAGNGVTNTSEIDGQLNVVNSTTTSSNNYLASMDYLIWSPSAPTSTTGVFGRQSEAVIPAASANTADYVYGAFDTAYNQGSGNVVGGLYGLSTQALSIGTGTVANVYGILSTAGVNKAGAANEAATITNSFGIYAQTNNSSTAGTITYQYGVYSGLPLSMKGTITNGYGVYIAGEGSGTGTWTNTPYDLYAADTTAENYFAGNVGIGITNPDTLFEVVGAGTTLPTTYNAGDVATFIAPHDDFNAVSIARGGTANPQGLTFGVNQTSLYSEIQASHMGAATDSLLLNRQGGSIGIGTANPNGYVLYVNGTAYATGAAGALSDRRHKKNIAPLGEGALALVDELKPVSFEWIDPRDDGMKGRQIGFIAQDVEPVIPEAVITAGDVEQTKGLKYDSLVPVLTKAIQELKADNDELRREISALEAEVQAKPNRSESMH